MSTHQKTLKISSNYIGVQLLDVIIIFSELTFVELYARLMHIFRVLQLMTYFRRDMAVTVLYCSNWLICDISLLQHKHCTLYLNQLENTSVGEKTTYEVWCSGLSSLSSGDVHFLQILNVIIVCWIILFCFNGNSMQIIYIFVVLIF